MCIIIPLRVTRHIRGVGYPSRYRADLVLTTPSHYNYQMAVTGRLDAW